MESVISIIRWRSIRRYQACSFLPESRPLGSNLLHRMELGHNYGLLFDIWPALHAPATLEEPCWMWEKTIPPRIDIRDCIICQHMQTLHTRHFFDGESWGNGPECIVIAVTSKWCQLSVGVCAFLYRSCHLNSLKSSKFHFNSFCSECSQIFKVLHVKAGVCLPAEKVTLWSLKLSFRGIKWMMLMQKVVSKTSFQSLLDGETNQRHFFIVNTLNWATLVCI